MDVPAGAVSWRYLPNALTALRILLVGPIAWSLAVGRYRTALALLVLAGASDGLDGFLARRYGWGTRLGAVLDPLADKLLLSVVSVVLAWLGHLPGWLAVLIVARDLVIVAGAGAFHLLIGEVQMRPSLPGKVSTAGQLLLIGVVVGARAGLPFPAWAEDGLIWFAAATTLWSGADYVYAWSRKAIAERRRG
jgi:cardiolipin synthase